MLTTFLREACINVTGEIYGAWVDEKRSNASLKKYLESDGYRVRTMSVEKAGTFFEAMYYNNPDFRDRFNSSLPKAGSEKVSMGSGDPCAGFCWQNLFVRKPPTFAPWVNTKALSRRQILEVSRICPLRTTSDFGVVKFKDLWHVVGGNMTPRELVNSMTDKTRIGMVPSLLPVDRSKTNLSPFVGDKLRTEIGRAHV